MSNPQKDGWYYVWFHDVTEEGYRYYTRAYFFADTKQWSKCGIPDECVMNPDGWGKEKPWQRSQVMDH